MSQITSQRRRFTLAGTVPLLACVLHHMRKGPSPSGKANVAFPVQSGAIHRQGMNEVKTAGYFQALVFMQKYL